MGHRCGSFGWRGTGRLKLIFSQPGPQARRRPCAGALAPAPGQRRGSRPSPNARAVPSRGSGPPMSPLHPNEPRPRAHRCGPAGRADDIHVLGVWLFGIEDHDCGILRWHSSRGFHDHGAPGQHPISPATPATRDTPAAQRAGSGAPASAARPKGASAMGHRCGYSPSCGARTGSEESPDDHGMRASPALSANIAEVPPV